jgi:hypothetical protein
MYKNIPKTDVSNLVMSIIKNWLINFDSAVILKMQLDCNIVLF